MLKIKPLRSTPPFKKPTKAYLGDAGWDIYSREDVSITPYNKYTFYLGFTIIGERGKMYRTEGKSGLAVRHGITTIGNIIDNGYRGEATVTLVNLGQETVDINVGDKIAQLVIYNVDDDNDLIETEFLEIPERGTGGFGSSGK